MLPLTICLWAQCPFPTLTFSFARTHCVVRSKPFEAFYMRVLERALTYAPPPGLEHATGGALGSTKNDRDLMVLKGGYFDVDPEKNPTFYNWNMLFLRYCDGGSFSGNRAEPVQVSAQRTACWLPNRRK